jgi:GntR family transcriptional repressor for pyruvate dehydrogenase complex
VNQPAPRKTAAKRGAASEPFANAGTVVRATVNLRRTEKISEVIAREIVKDSRGLPPGTMLPSEAKLLERYQVGRASLREALRLLEVQGLIVIRPGPGGGPMISEVDSAHFGRMASLYFHLSGATYRDTLDARLILEPVVARIIATEQNPEHIQALKDYLERSAADTADPSATDATDPQDERVFEFHALLMGMSGNPVITLLARSLQDLLIDRWTASRSELERGHDFTHVHDMDVHDMIARAIIDGRADEAERLMREHMDDFVRYQLEHDPRRLDQTVSWH